MTEKESIHGVPVIHTGAEERVVCYFATRALYDLLPAAYGSLLAHTLVDRVVLMIEDDNLPFRLPERVQCLNVREQRFFPPGGPNITARYTYMALMKMTLPFVFPDLNRALVMDMDTIVKDDLGELWEISLRGKYFAAVREPTMSSTMGRDYANAGVMMINLRLMRDSGMCRLIIDDLNVTKRAYPEQDCLHAMCGDDFVRLPVRYNCSCVTRNITASVENVAVEHFAAELEWWWHPEVTAWLLRADPGRKSVCYIGNRKVYGMMLASAKSLLCHSPVDRIYFLIEDDAFPEPLPEIFRCINVSGQKWFRSDGPNYHPYYSCMTTLRAALSRILTEEERVLLLDPDTVVVSDLSGIWNYDVTDDYFAAVQEVRNHDHEKDPYYNAGVMLMNLKKIREDGMDERLIQEINTVAYRHLEQDALNYLCDGAILELPPMYNASFVSQPCSYPRIMHFLDKSKQFFPEAASPYAGRQWPNVVYANTTAGKIRTEVTGA